MRDRAVGQASERTGGWLVLTFLLGAAAPAAAIVLLGRAGLDISGALVIILLAAVAFDALALVIAGLASLRSVGDAAWEPVPGTWRGRWRRLVAEETYVLTRGMNVARLVAWYRRVWRPVLVWLTPVVPAAAGYWLAQLAPNPRAGTLAPVIALLVVYVAAPAVLRSIFASVHADDDRRSHQPRFVPFALAWMAGLGALYNSAARVAQLRLALGRELTAEARPMVEEIEPAGAAETGTAPRREEATPVPAGAAAEPAAPAAPEAPAEPPRPPLSPAGRRVVAAAERLPEVIATLVHELQRGDGECHRLRAQIEALQRAVGMERDFEVCACEADWIGPQALVRLQNTLAALERHPTDVLTLAALAEQADVLAGAVTAYARLRSTAGEE